MQKCHLNSAINAAREMIQYQYIHRNVDGIIKHLSSENFSFIGFIGGNTFDSKASFIKYSQNSLNQVLSYELIDENYSVCSESDDSCQILAKITFVHAQTQKSFVLNHFFYFNRFGNEITCTHLHVSRQFDMNKANRLVFFNENMPYPKLPWEIQGYNENMMEVINSEAVAEKSFYYDAESEIFPYRIVNSKFIKLLGYKTIREFVNKQNNSSLANIDAADRADYVKYLKNCYENNVACLDLEEKCQYLGTYYVNYRLKSPHLVEEVHVLEWGNFFTERGRTIVNCFVFNLNETKKISAGVNLNKLLREDYGIHIRRDIVVYLRSHRIKIDGEIIELTPFEGEIFLVLVDNLNQAVKTEKIYEEIYKNSSLQMTSNVLAMHISNIRRKLNSYKHLIQIVFVRDEGYCLRI